MSFLFTYILRYKEQFNGCRLMKPFFKFMFFKTEVSVKNGFKDRKSVYQFLNLNKTMIYIFFQKTFTFDTAINIVNLEIIRKIYWLG